MLAPHGHTWQADRRETGFLGTQTVFDVIEFDEHGHREADFLDYRDWNQAHPPAIEILIDALMAIRKSRSGSIEKS